MRSTFRLLVLLSAVAAAPNLAAQAQVRSDYCSPGTFAHGVVHEAKTLGLGLLHAPRSMARPDNLKWELPIGAATGVLIAEDRAASNRIQSPDLEQLAGRWSNIGLGVEIASSGVAYVVGCRLHDASISNNGFKGLVAMGSAGLIDLGLKAAFNRQYPYGVDSPGRFWAGGKSFPSGHSAVSFAWAAETAHHTHNKWVKVAAYALAAGVSFSRYPAKKHFPSDILIGATIGYVTGTYLAGR